MKKKNTATIVLYILGGILTINLTMAALIPFLGSVLAIEVKGQEIPGITVTPFPEKPEELLLTAIYQMEEDSKEITAIYIEVFHIGNRTVSYMEVPVNTRATMSTELYKSLQTYSPELPQYMKLSKMAEGFSDEYALTACNRILSEVIGVSVAHYVSADAERLREWMDTLAAEKTAAGFFADYTEWVQNSVSDLTMEERWMYYESWKKINTVTTEPAPGIQNKDEYTISAKQATELLEKMMRRSEKQN